MFTNAIILLPREGEPTALESVVSSITTTFAQILPSVPVVVGAAIGLSLVFWGTRKLIGIFKSSAK